LLKVAERAIDFYDFTEYEDSSWRVRVSVRTPPLQGFYVSAATPPFASTSE